MRLKKFFASLFAVLLVFSCSLPHLSKAYADEVSFQLYCPPVSWNSQYLDTKPVLCGYTPTNSIPYCKWSDYTSYIVSNNVTIDDVTFTSSIYDSSSLSGKTVYVGWYIALEEIISGNPIIGVSSANINVYSNPTYVQNSSYWNPISSSVLATASPTTGTGQFRTSQTTAIAFTVPSDSHSFRIVFNNYKVLNGQATVYGVFFPILYVAGWGNEIASSLNSILAELLDQGRSLDNILSVLNSIYTEATKISSDTAAIRSLMVTCANKLTSADSHLANIENTVDDIYDLLFEALSEESEELSDEAAELGDSISQRIDSEQYWNDKNTSNYNAIGLDTFTFSNGILSGLQLVGTIFTNVWNAMGEATLPIIFALTLGISLVVIGRIGRSSGGGRSSKKDDK